MRDCGVSCPNASAALGRRFPIPVPGCFLWQALGTPINEDLDSRSKLKEMICTNMGHRICGDSFKIDDLLQG